MLSTLAIIGIFAEIFACGLLLSGAAAFLKKYFITRQGKDMALGFVFLSFSLFIGLTIASSLLYNLGKPVSLLITLQKVIAWDLLLGSLLLLIFIKARFKLNWLAYLIYFYAGAAVYMAYRIAASSVILVYSPGVIEPVVTFSLPTPARTTWVLAWLILSLAAFFSALKQKGSQRSLLVYDSVAAFFVFCSYLTLLAYTGTQDSYYLLFSWFLTLVGTIGLTLGEIVPPDSPLAKNPFNFFRSRILFKLIFIFVLLTVILIEVTTIATLTLSRHAMLTYIFSNYREAARNTAIKIQALPQLTPAAAQKIVEGKKVGRSGIAFVVDAKGNLVAHPDMGRVVLRPNLKDILPVKNALAGRPGFGQFPPDEFGETKVGAYVPLLKSGGAVIVEEPINDAYYELRQLETNSLLFVIVGIALTVLTGLLLTQSIESPIHKLIIGTENVSRGDLGSRIEVDSIDELGRLAQAFNKMTHDLRDSQERLILSEKLASLGTMAAGMAHEIKNPLVSLRTFTQLLEQKWEDKEFRDKFSQIVPTEIERINKIAESLLKFGRPMKPEMRPLNVNTLLEEIMILFESECKKNSIRISIKLAELPEIIGDAQQLSQAFVNIILNAIQSMEKGGSLIIKTDVGEVIHLGPTAKKVMKEDGSIVWGEEESRNQPIKAVFIEITDTGPGIKAENLKSLFDPFFTTKIKGTGMGLPITLRIIEEHKGSIKVKSEEGKGTTFIITLPQKL